MNAITLSNLSHRYGERQALDNVSLAVRPGELFCLLGPNGSGKSTMFKIISTLLPVQSGEAKVFDLDLKTQPAEIRHKIGVVFQHPALDKQLTVAENLRFHARLFGLSAADVKARMGPLLERFGLADRANELVESLSGGMRRKVELAKALLAAPQLLILDEPSTGLDVSARIELWRLIGELRTAEKERGGDLTVVLTTHLMDEADRCDRLAILDRGKLLAVDTPAALKDRLGGDVITLTTADAVELQQKLKQLLGIDAHPFENRLRIERPEAHKLIPQLIEAAPGLIDSVSVGRPTLDDVFIQMTGRGLLVPSPGTPGEG